MTIKLPSGIEITHAIGVDDLDLKHDKPDFAYWLREAEKAKRQGKTHKVWLSKGGSTGRESHARADGQRVLIDEPFTIGGKKMMYPGDPAGGDENSFNCRCSVKFVEVSQADKYRRCDELEQEYVALAKAIKKDWQSYDQLQKQYEEGVKEFLAEVKRKTPEVHIEISLTLLDILPAPNKLGSVGRFFSTAKSVAAGTLAVLQYVAHRDHLEGLFKTLVESPLNNWSRLADRLTERSKMADEIGSRMKREACTLPLTRQHQ